MLKTVQHTTTMQYTILKDEGIHGISLKPNFSRLYTYSEIFWFDLNKIGKHGKSLKHEITFFIIGNSCNIVTNGEISHYEQVLLFAQCFSFCRRVRQNASACGKGLTLDLIQKFNG